LCPAYAGIALLHKGDQYDETRLAYIRPGKDGGSITVLRPDGSEASFSPVYGKGIAVPWAVSVDGNDHIWISNLTSASAGIVELCGFRTETCPPGMKSGDAISPPGGYLRSDEFSDDRFEGCRHAAIPSFPVAIQISGA